MEVQNGENLFFCRSSKANEGSFNLKPKVIIARMVTSKQVEDGTVIIVKGKVGAGDAGVSHDVLWTMGSTLDTE